MRLFVRLFVWIVCTSIAILLDGCAFLPPAPHTDDSIALTKKIQQYQPAKQGLSHIIGEQIQHYPQLSGYYPIATGANAFASRSILTDMATQSIDVQYYIWHNDEAGQLMLKDLWEAAERGVIVRFLLDDINSSDRLDNVLANFAKHPNIAVRLVNPGVYRKRRELNYLTSPTRMNRRMHNKSMTFDRHVSIIGGRNVGDEYLNNNQASNFADLDVLLIGSVVPKINESFDDFWQSPLSYDIETLVVAKPKKLDLGRYYKDNTKKNTAPKDQQALKTYREAIATSTIGDDLLSKKIPFRWTKIEFVGDQSSKLSGNHHAHSNLVHQLQQHFGTPTKNLSIISSYFVPTKEGTQGLVRLAKQGVSVQILTNSYDATDVGLVHSGYANHRKALLQAGVRLFELKSTAIPQDNTGSERNTLWRTRGQTTTSLHAKAFAVDADKVFIGSYNVDPRSANLNTEMGVIVYDNELAEQVHEAFGDGLLEQAYELKLKDDKIQWHTIENGQAVVYDKEPFMQLGDKVGIYLIAYLPIEWLL